MAYKIQVIRKGKVVNESRIAQSKAQVFRWLPHWKENSLRKKGETIKVVQHTPKKRKVKRNTNPFSRFM